jgi:hypothetical protein
MMWLAAMGYFAERQVHVAYVAHINAYRPDSLRRAVGDGRIVMCGGVGLGTLWPTHTELKRVVARDFPHNPILVLPSTLAFRNRAEQEEVFAGDEADADGDGTGRRESSRHPGDVAPSEFDPRARRSIPLAPPATTPPCPTSDRLASTQ